MGHTTLIAALVLAAQLASSLAISTDTTLSTPSLSFQAETSNPSITGHWAFSGPVENAFITFIDDTSYATPFALSPEGYLQLSANSSFYANVDSSGTSQVVFFNSAAAIAASGWTYVTCEQLGLSLHCCAESGGLSLNKLYACPCDWAASGALVIAPDADEAGSECSPLQLRSGPKPLKFGEAGGEARR